MKRIGTFVCALLILSQTGFASGNLKKSAAVPVKSVSIVDSDEESTVKLIVAEDVKDSNGKIVIKSGTPVTADVQLTPRKSIGRSGAIDIKLSSVETVEGETIRLIGGTTVKPKDIRGKVLGISLGVGLATPLVPMLFYMFKKGNPAVLPEGTIIYGNPVTDYTF